MEVMEGGPDAAAHFAATGWVVTEPLSPDVRDQLARWIDEVARLDDASGVLHHRERTSSGVQLCRTEDFATRHPDLGELLTTGVLVDTASLLLGEPAVLYKEKINYKLPGGAGFAPHQDAPAYPFVDVHLSCLIAIDDVDTENGCLEVVSNAHREILPMDERGCVRADIVASMTWHAVTLTRGQVLWFDSRTPHRSAMNSSAVPRRALYPTYSAARSGDLRADYYAAKRREFDADEPGSHRISLIGDFEGVVV